MKTLTFALAVLFIMGVLLFASGAEALGRCFPTYDGMAAWLKQEFHEEPAASGEFNAQVAAHLFVSPEGTWTIVTTHTTGLSCVKLDGKAWSGPILPGVPA